MGNYIRENSRQQGYLLPPRMEDWVPKDHPARVIDGFVESLDIESLEVEENNDDVGRKSYSPRTMIKIILYCYSIGDRSSRRIERLTYENIAVRWLSGDLHPDYRTIARFRQMNIGILTRLLAATVSLYREAYLSFKEFEGVVFIDGTKIYADANADRPVDIKRLEKMAERILREAEEVDKEEDKQYGEDRSGDKISPDVLSGLREKITEQKERLEEKIKRGPKADRVLKKIERLERGIELFEKESEDNSDKKGRVNVTDPDCRFMKHRSHGKHPSYNGQIAVDSNGVIMASDVVQEAGDNHQLSRMVKESKKILGETVEIKKVPADKGYYEVNELRDTMEMGVIPIVKKQSPVKKGKDGFSREDFKYNKEKDVWLCPAGKELRYREIRHDKGKEYRVYQCSVKACRECKFKDKCLSKRGSEIKRGRVYRVLNDMEFLEKYAAIMKDEINLELYKGRKQTVEPAIGVIKRCLGFRRFSLRGLKKVRGEFSLIATVYNLKKITNLCKANGIMTRLEYNIA